MLQLLMKLLLCTQNKKEHRFNEVRIWIVTEKIKVYNKFQDICTSNEEATIVLC